jgi:hypothetical protein
MSHQDVLALQSQPPDMTHLCQHHGNDDVDVNVNASMVSKKSEYS